MNRKDARETRAPDRGEFALSRMLVLGRRLMRRLLLMGCRLMRRLLVVSSRLLGGVLVFRRMVRRIRVRLARLRCRGRFRLRGFTGALRPVVFERLGHSLVARRCCSGRGGKRSRRQSQKANDQYRSQGTHDSSPFA